MAAKNHKAVKFGKHDIIGFAVFGVFYFCWYVLLPGKAKAGKKQCQLLFCRYGFLIGLTAVNIIAFPLLFLVFFGSKTSRQALFTFAPLLLYVFLYDSNRVLRKFHVFEVHTEDIYQAEVRGSELYIESR